MVVILIVKVIFFTTVRKLSLLEGFYINILRCCCKLPLVCLFSRTETFEFIFTKLHLVVFKIGYSAGDRDEDLAFYQSAASEK